MAEKPLWGRVGDKVTDKLVELSVAAVVTGLSAGFLLARQWIASKCVHSQCTISEWSFALLIAATVIISLAAVVLGIWLFKISRQLRTARASQAPAAPVSSKTRVYAAADAPFQKITVIDERLKLRWFIIRPPKEWLPWRDIQNTLSPQGVQQVLDGPFHAVPGCNAPLGERWVGSALEDKRHLIFVDKCPSCGKRIFRPLIVNAATTLPIAFAVRAHALEELQRMERNGTVLDGTVPVVLEKPNYWKAMLPP